MNTSRQYLGGNTEKITSKKTRGHTSIELRTTAAKKIAGTHETDGA